MICQLVDYEVLDQGQIRVHFVSPDPAPYSQSDFYVQISSTEATQNQTQLRTTLTTRLQEKYGNPVFDSATGQYKGQGVAALNTAKAATPITVT